MTSNTLHYYLMFLSFKGNITWTCSVGAITSLSVAFISFARKVAIDFCQFFSQLFRMLSSLNVWNKKWGSPCALKTKQAFISLSGLVWGKSLTFYTNARSCARTLIMQKSCTVGIRNAKQGNRPKGNLGCLHKSTLSCSKWCLNYIFY